MTQGDMQRSIARRRTDSVFRIMMLVFAIGFLAFAVVGYVVTKEVGIVVLFVCIYGMSMVLGLWGKRWIMRNIDRH